MAAIITEKFRLNNATQFFESFSETDERYYMFIGKATPFTSGTTGGSDTSPPTPLDDITSENYRWDSMLGANQIASSDVSKVINRRTFVSGTTYDMFEHNISSSNPANNSGATNLFDSTFYFITAAFRVYKVLYNLNSSGATFALSSEPTFTSPVKQFVGGYYLQYMFTLTTTEINKFLIPTIDSSNYNSYDKEYFKRFFKLYLGFFFCLDMKKKEITKISPFFQLPSKESKQELIFFPTSIYEDKNKFINISYSLGDNRSYLCKLHSEVIKSSLYDKENINIHTNFDINVNYYLELLRTLRIVFKFSHKLKDYVKYPKKEHTKREKRSLMKNSVVFSKSKSKGSLKRKNKSRSKKKNKSKNKRKSKKK